MRASAVRLLLAAWATALVSAGCGSPGASSGATAQVVTPWDTGTLGANGRSLTIFYAGGACVGIPRQDPHPHVDVEDQGRIIEVTLRTTPFVYHGTCADIGLRLSASVVLPRKVPPADVVDGGCHPDEPPTAGPAPMPGDNPCLPGSPRVRSARPDTCSPRGPTDPRRVVPGVSVTATSTGVRITARLTVTPGAPCHLDEYIRPRVFVNYPTGQHVEVLPDPSWGAPEFADVGPGGAVFQASWMWDTWCGPAGVFEAYALTDINGNSEPVATTIHPPCPTAPPATGAASTLSFDTGTLRPVPP